MAAFPPPPPPLVPFPGSVVGVMLTANSNSSDDQRMKILHSQHLLKSSTGVQAITLDNHGPQPNVIRPELVGLITHINIYVYSGASSCLVIVHLVLIGSVNISTHLHALRLSVSTSWVLLSLPHSYCTFLYGYNLIIGMQAQ
ncbi:hypothetical protein C4D60_Mb09t16330 [Musa balbisiana]|uniref:Uncharacterized protein n=1 Tax=Musa balbisiana TaxID=52838 RepID=A0A4S8IGW9_MUSBA|nr:hypothetical protein C4D60_Mb09t16330 [Musa balbisiana]